MTNLSTRLVSGFLDEMVRADPTSHVTRRALTVAFTHWCTRHDMPTPPMKRVYPVIRTEFHILETRGKERGFRGIRLLPDPHEVSK